MVQIRGYEASTDSSDILKELDGSRILVKEMLQLYLHDKGYYYFVDRDKIAVLVADNSENENAFKLKMEEIIKTAHNKVWEHYRIRTAFYVGRVYTDLENVYLSYEQAKWALDYQHFQNIDRDILWYSQISKRDEQYNYPVEQEIRIMNLVKAGNKQELEKLLKDIYVENFVRRALSDDMKHQLMFEMRGTIIKLSDQLDLFEKFRFKIRTIECSSDVDKFYDLIMDMYNELCDSVNERKTNKATMLKKDIIKYIHDFFTDPNLSLGSIASEFGVTEQYLSQFFKKQTGQNFSAYLEKVRIDYACTLLKNDALSIKAISYKVGYNSDKTFRRAFKRVKGVSPTSFRRDLAENI